jgi:hypothetical protein
VSVRDRAVGSSDRVLWWSAFAGLAVLTFLWALALPLFASPDEPAHAVRAAALARGQVVGQEVSPTSPSTRVQVPRSLADGHSACFAFHPDRPATCQPPVSSSTALHPATTYVGHYPPLYYVPVGLAGRIAGGAHEARLQRLGGALACAALLASAVVSLRSWRQGRAAAGLALAISPMALFLAGTVNPSGLEVAAAICLWVTALPLLQAPALASRRLAVRAAVAASALALTRPMSPLWLACIGLVVLVVTPWPALREAVRVRRVQVAVLAAGLAPVLAVTWVLAVDALRVVPSSDPRRPAGLGLAVQTALSSTDDRIHQMIGNFGWLDTPAPAWTVYVWLLCLGALVVPALAARPARRAVAVGLLVLLTLAVPVAIEASQAGRLGYIWSGRYTLPLAAGLPLVAAWALRGRDRRLDVTVVVLAATAQVWAFVTALSRYTVGLGHQDLGLLHPVWSPVLPPLLLVSLYALATCALGGLLLAATADRSESDVPQDVRTGAQVVTAV